MNLFLLITPVVVVFEVDQVVLVDESVGAVQICARISEGFIERESDIIIALTAVEFQNEATFCKQINCHSRCIHTFDVLFCSMYM